MTKNDNLNYWKKYGENVPASSVKIIRRKLASKLDMAAAMITTCY